MGDVSRIEISVLSPFFQIGLSQFKKREKVLRNLDLLHLRKHE